MKEGERAGAGVPRDDEPAADAPGWRLAAPAAATGILGAHAAAAVPWLTDRPALCSLLVIAAAAVALAAAGGFLRRVSADREALEPERIAVRGGVALPVLMLVLGFTAWSAATHERVAPDDLRRLAGEVAVPVVVEGTLVGDVTVRAADRGAFAAFNYRRPRTLGRLRVENRWDAEAGVAVPATGTVLLKINEPAPWLAEGRRVRVTGTLQAFTRPENPGSYDFAAAMERAGVGGRLTARRASGVIGLPPTPGPARNLALLKGGLRERAWDGLRRASTRTPHPPPCSARSCSAAKTRRSTNSATTSASSGFRTCSRSAAPTWASS